MREAEQARAKVTAFLEMVNKTEADFEAGLAKLRALREGLGAAIDLLYAQTGSAAEVAASYNRTMTGNLRSRFDDEVPMRRVGNQSGL